MKREYKTGSIATALNTGGNRYLFRGIESKKMRVAQPAMVVLFDGKTLIGNEGLGNEAHATMAALVSTQVWLPFAPAERNVYSSP